MNRLQEATAPHLHSVSVAGAAVREGGRLLTICRADNGNRDSLGPIVELDETPRSGIARKVMAEAVIHGGAAELAGARRDMTLGVDARAYRCKLPTGAERTSGKSTAVSWLTPDEVNERMSEAFAVRPLEASDGNESDVRSHDGRQLLTP